MSTKRRVLFIALPLAVVVGVVAALFLQKHAGLGGGAGAADNAPGATRTAAGAGGDSTSANGSGASATASKRRPGGSAAADDGADAEDVGGTEPVWGVRISGLPQGDDLYSLDVDGKWLADPKNPTRSPQSSLSRMFSSNNGLLGFNSLLRWPVPDAKPPESVRIASPTSAEFRYTGRIRQAVVYRSPERDADWGTDEMKPRNAGARANLDAILADPMLGHVQGAVLDAERRAIAGARVQVTWMPTAAVISYRQAKRTVVTGENGRFSIDRLDLGPGSLLVRAAGHPMSRAIPVRIGRGEGTPIEVVLEAGVIVSGSVTNAAGKPVAGAIVTVRFASNSAGGRTRANPPPPVITNAAGLYTITSLGAGTYDFAATAEGWGDALRRSVSFVIGEAPAAIDLVLADGLALRGRVVRKQGAEDVGVPRANVVTYPNQRNRSRAASYSPHFAVSDAKGDFVVTGLVPNVEIYVMASQGLAQTTKQEQVTLTEGAAPPSVELRLPEAGRIAGRVVLPSGAPASGVQVAPVNMSQGGGFNDLATYREYLGDSFPQAVTGPDGAFALSGLPLTSAFTVEARGEGYAPARAENVSCNSPNETLLTLIKGGKITGHVVEKTGDRPLAQMRVSLTPGSDNNYGGQGSENPSAITDAAGAFSFDLLRPATYQADAQGLVPGSDGSERWYFVVGSGDLEVRADASASVVLKASPGGTLRGKVLTQGTDQPVEGASVSANLQQDRGRVGRFGMASNMGGGQFWTQAEGVFEIPDLMPGLYNLRASKEGFYFSGNPQQNTVVRPGESTDNVIVRLGQGGVVRGIVLDPDGQPVPDAALQIRRAQPVSGQGSGRYVNTGDGGFSGLGYYGGSGGGTVGSATSGTDGRFECVGLDPSASPLRVATTTGAGPDGAWVGESDDVTITSGTLLAEVTLRLKVGGSLSGRVLDENEKPLEGVRIGPMRQSNDGSRSYGGSDTGVRTNAAGEYTAGGLTAGNYTLSANKEGYSSEQRDRVTVADGQPTPGIDLKMSKGRPVTGSVVDPAGVGLAGWSVSANSNSPGTNRGGSNVTTDSDGKFTLQSGLTGTVRFNLSMNRSARPGKQSYSSYTSGDVDLPAGEVKDPITLTLVSHTVKGRIVLTGSKKPVAGVDVMVNVYSRNGTAEAEGTQCVSQNANLSAREKTGEDGVFVIETVPNGTHNFLLEGKGFVRKDSINMELEGTGVLDAGDIEVEAARSITARLLDASTRQPYQPTQATDNVQVRTSDDLSENSSSTGVTLDEDGRFTLDKAAPATTRLTVSAGGYQPLDVADIKLRDDGPTDLGDLLLEQGCTLAGFFYDVAEGKPLARVQGPYGQQRFNVQVEIQDANGKARSANGFRFEGDEGKFEVRGVSRDIQSAKFTFQSDQFLPVKITAIPTPDGAGRMDLGRVDLASGGVILGIVVDAKDVPCPNAQAQVSTQPAPPPKPGEPPASNRNQQTIQRYSQTDGEGKFRAAALSDGQYRVSVTALGFAPAVLSDVAVTSGGQATRVRIVVSPGTKLAGTLTDLGTHILSKWQVNAQAADSDGNSYGGGNSAQTDTLGHFELADVPNGSARLSFSYNQQSKKGNTSMSFRSAPLDPSGDEVVFILPFGPEIKGRLVDESGAGIPGARIAVSQNGGNRGGGNPGATPDKPEDGCSLQNLNLTVESATDESGRFKIGPVAVGSAQITISGEMMSKKNLDKIVIGVDDEHDLGDVTVQGGGVLVGRFVDKVTGAPARISENDSVNCMIRRTNGGDNVNFKAKGPDASFRVGGIPADVVSVTFNVSPYLPCQIKEPKVTVGNETDLGDVPLDPGVTLRFKLTDAATGLPYGGNNTGVQISGQRQGGMADTPGGGPGSGSWSSGGQSKDDGVCLIRPAPSDLSQITITPRGCEALVIDSVPLPDSKGIVDLGERKVTRKAGPNGQ